jgi:hypothetical protein
MDAVVVVDAVERKETRNGNTRFVLRDADGKEYTTFRPQIGEQAERCAGGRARIEFHEEQRGGFHNVYLDAIAPAGEDDGDGAASSPDEAAWRTAVDAAPWLVGSRDPKKAVPPDQLFEALKPFKDRVAEDIEEGEEEDPA